MNRHYHIWRVDHRDGTAERMPAAYPDRKSANRQAWKGYAGPPLGVSEVVLACPSTLISCPLDGAEDA